MDARFATLSFLGENSRRIEIGALDFRDVQIKGVAHRYELRFAAQFTPSASEVPERRSSLRLWADVKAARDSGKSPVAIGRAQLDAPIYLEPPQPTPQSVTGRPPIRHTELVLGLDRRGLDELERIRDGGDVVFTFWLAGEVLFDGAVGPIGAEPHLPQFDAKRSHWTDLLSICGYHRYVTFELPVTEDQADPDLARAVDALRNAQEALARGEYEEAVADCRPGLEALCEKGRSQFKSGALTLSPSAGKEERYWQATNALRHLTGAAHHPNDPVETDEHGSPAPIRWDRHDAAAAIRVLAALICQRTATN